MSPTLPGRLADHAARTPDRVALRHKQRGRWHEITWRSYRDHVAAAAHGLHALGVGPGDAVAILSDNRPEWLYADLAAQALGARAVGLYQTLPAADVACLLAHAEVKVLVCEDQEQVDKAVEITGDTPTVAHVLCIEPRGTRSYGDPRLRPWAAWHDAGHAAHAADPAWFASRLRALDPAEPTMVVYTSGTTGPPKGALLSARNALAVVGPLVEAFGAGPDDQILSYLPLCHVAEKTYSQYLPLTAGCTVHFGESVATVQRDLREVSPTIFLGVPRIWEKMHASVTLRLGNASGVARRLFDLLRRRLARYRDPDRDAPLTGWARLEALAADVLVFRAIQEHLGLRRCRLPASGAAPVAPELLRWFHAIGVPIREAYGMTECAGATHANLPGRNRLGTVGSTLPPLQTAIADDGEVLVRGPAVFEGYLKDPDATRASIDPDGWYHTGDLGETDEEGYLRITGRKKEILITAGGKNLSPEKIENALKLSPYIKEAVAVGDGQPYVGALVQIDADAVGDWATRRDLAYTDLEDLTQRAEVVALIEREVRASDEHLARVEQVRRVWLLPRELLEDEGELTPTQKVRRKVIAERWRTLVEDLYR